MRHGRNADLDLIGPWPGTFDLRTDTAALNLQVGDGTPIRVGATTWEAVVVIDMGQRVEPLCTPPGFSVGLCCHPSVEYPNAVIQITSVPDVSASCKT